ncbi:molybdopterin converting factor subunit 1 [Kordiimonas sp.]|uniref:molybdopterin converting factor subunit 1 n=1 Tax=Kordiimonas sp. TaxID=1970157 RepID=UPI003A953F9D
MTMVHLLYFSWVRERVGKSEEMRDLPSDVATVAGLIDYLKSQGDQYAAALEDIQHIRVAVNQTHSSAEHPVTDGDEVAFFPPVTGG